MKKNFAADFHAYVISNRHWLTLAHELIVAHRIVMCGSLSESEASVCIESSNPCVYVLALLGPDSIPALGMNDKVDTREVYSIGMTYYLAALSY